MKCAPSSSWRSTRALADAVDRVVAQNPDLQSAHWGLVIADERGQPLYEHDADRLFTPASCLKLITGAAARTALGSDAGVHVLDVAQAGAAHREARGVAAEPGGRRRVGGMVEAGEQRDGGPFDAGALAGLRGGIAHGEPEQGHLSEGPGDGPLDGIFARRPQLDVARGDLAERQDSERNGGQPVPATLGDGEREAIALAHLAVDPQRRPPLQHPAGCDPCRRGAGVRHGDGGEFLSGGRGVLPDDAGAAVQVSTRKGGGRTGEKTPGTRSGNPHPEEALVMSVLPVPEHRLAEFCRRNHIRRLSLFGSRLKGTAGDDSDVDLLVEFEPDAGPGLIGMACLERELSEMLGGCRVDLRTPMELSRHFRDEVMRSAATIYAA